MIRLGEYVVELHDIHPGTLAAYETWTSHPRIDPELCAVLVVPWFERRERMEPDTPLVRRLRSRASLPVLHGYTHSLGRQWWNRLVFGTEDHGELARSDKDTARRRVDDAVACFTECFGEPPRWFCAPRWQLSAAARAAVQGCGIEGVLELGGVRLRSRWAEAPAVGFDDGSRGWLLRAARPFRTGKIRRLLETRRAFRLCLHPVDLERPAIRAEIDALLDQLHREGWRPVALDRFEADTPANGLRSCG